jgi:hypothetical protein
MGAEFYQPQNLHWIGDGYQVMHTFLSVSSYHHFIELGK